MIYRLYRLYFLIVLADEASGVKFWGPIIFSWVPSLLLAISMHFIPGIASTAPVLEDYGLTCHVYSRIFLGLVYFTVLCQIIFCFVILLDVTYSI